MVKWTKEETTYLIDNYNMKTAPEIGTILNRSEISIQNKILKLGLVKYCIDKSYETVFKTAKKYSCRSDFKRYDYYMYEIATKNNWLEDVCSHMIFKVQSKPQLYLRELLDKLFNMKSIYNDRKTIKPLELDIYYPEMKLAFEYNGNNWHSDIDVIIRDKIKQEKCLEKGIILIIIEEGKYFSKYHYEENIKKCLEEYGYKVSDIEVDILNKILNIEDVTTICNRYDNYNNWRKDNPQLYNKLSKIKMLERFTSHMYKRSNKI